jgi:hypothetical protein
LLQRHFFRNELARNPHTPTANHFAGVAKAASGLR